jgi:toxin-antitoxin system PIN domain toxin
MIIPDINLLVYAYDSESPYHQKAAKWWISCLSGKEPVGLPWIVALGFIRLWTNSRVFINPMPIDTAITHVESWLARRTLKLIHPGPDHPDCFSNSCAKKAKAAT